MCVTACLLEKDIGYEPKKTWQSKASVKQISRARSVVVDEGIVMLISGSQATPRGGKGPTDKKGNLWPLRLLTVGAAAAGGYVIYQQLEEVHAAFIPNFLLQCLIRCD